MGTAPNTPFGGISIRPGLHWPAHQGGRVGETGVRGGQMMLPSFPKGRVDLLMTMTPPYLPGLSTKRLKNNNFKKAK